MDPAPVASLVDRAVRFAGALPRRGGAVVRRLARRSSSNFKFAFFFLSPAQREALGHVYAFCRVVDDIVDERAPGAAGVAEAREALDRWRREIARIYDDPAEGGTAPESELGRSLAAARRTFDLPRFAFEEIVAGVEMDLDRSIYDTYDDLRLYCYRVASCVGFLALAIFGDQGEAARRYGEHLGLALQYTNILRDVGEDALRGRVYLPAEHLARFGLSSADVLRRRYDDRFVAAARAFADRAEREYAAAWSHLPGANRRALVAAEVMGRTYHRILDELRAHDFNVFARSASLRRRDKLRAAASALVHLALPAAPAPTDPP